MLKIGVLGDQNFGEKQIDAIKAVGNFQLMGFFSSDNNPSVINFDNSIVQQFDSVDQFCDHVDAVYISNPTIEQFELFVHMLKRSKHLFFEKLIVFSPRQSSKLLEIALEAGTRIQVGHLDRYNSAFVAVQSKLNHPTLIVSKTEIPPFQEKHQEVINLLIDDIVIAMQVIRSEIKKIHATGISVFGNLPDIIHAKIEFINGAVANLTGSRISDEKRHQTEFYGQNSYVKVDFLKELSKTLIINLAQQKGNIKNQEVKYQFKQIESKPVNTITVGLRDFYNSIVHNIEPDTFAFLSFKAIQIAGQILNKISSTNNFD